VRIVGSFMLEALRIFYLLLSNRHANFSSSISMLKNKSIKLPNGLDAHVARLRLAYGMNGGN
jgi:hypothetical protein